MARHKSIDITSCQSSSISTTSKWSHHRPHRCAPATVATPMCSGQHRGVGGVGCDHSYHRKTRSVQRSQRGSRSAPSPTGTSVRFLFLRVRVALNPNARFALGVIEAQGASFQICSPPRTARSALPGIKSTRLTHSGRGGENSSRLSTALPPRRLAWERLRAFPCSHLSKEDTWMESWKCNLHSETPEAISRHDLSRPAATSLLPFNTVLMGCFVKVASD